MEHRDYVCFYANVFQLLRTYNHCQEVSLVEEEHHIIEVKLHVLGMIGSKFMYSPELLQLIVDNYFILS